MKKIWLGVFIYLVFGATLSWVYFNYAVEQNIIWYFLALLVYSAMFYSVVTEIDFALTP